MTKEKNINASAAKDKFADELLSDDELENVAGGTTARMHETFARPGEDRDNTNTRLGPGTSTRF